MKKIAIVIAVLDMPGGAEKVAADLAVEFHRRDYDVTVIKFDHLLPGEVLLEVPCRVLEVDIPERTGGFLTQAGILLKRAWCFRRIFQREKFDHIFSFMEAANLPTALVAPGAVLSVHLDPGTLTRSEWVAFRWVYPRAKQVITVSKQMQHLLEVKAGLNNVCCIYNPVDTRLVHEKSKQAIAVKGRFILAVGRLARQKRFDLLLAAFAKTRACQDCLLVILGTGEEQQQLQAQIVNLNLENCVLLAGFDDNPYKYMARAEFQVMSSDHEGYPLVLIEALALGCPVLSTDCPTGPKEIIQPGVNGLLVETGNADAIARGIDQLFFDDELREKLSRQAAESVRDNDVAAVADRWLAV